MSENKTGEIVIYQTDDGQTKIDVRFEDEAVWLTQAQLVDLYQSSKANISEHIKHIFEEGELDEVSVVRNFRTTAADGKLYNTNYYNLDMIISLGYRVKSILATRFRRWATEQLKEYLICMRLALIMTLKAKSPSLFSRWCRTSYIMLRMGIPQPKSSLNGRMPINRLWV